HFDGSRGLQQHQHLRRSIGYIGEGMRHLPRCKSTIPGFQIELVITYPDYKLPLDYIKPFILFIMQMQSGPSPLLAEGIVNAQLSIGILSGDLAIESTTHHQ